MLSTYQYYWKNKDYILSEYIDKMVILYDGGIFKIAELSESIFDIAPPLSLIIIPSADPISRELCFVGKKISEGMRCGSYSSNQPTL